MNGFLKMVKKTWVWILFDISTLISDHECSTKKLIHEMINTENIL